MDAPTYGADRALDGAVIVDRRAIDADRQLYGFRLVVEREISGFADIRMISDLLLRGPFQALNR